ncbi:DUF1656 domain-containing protein [Acetobacter fabarum]|uniref:DUF1656 domain-containing protein n=1 Tax=Acetobacter fabarum TaxID=483199 RepID=UPI0033AA09A3
MLAEIDIGGVFVAPITVYAVCAIPMTLLIRFLLQRSGLAQWFWHLSLFDIALYAGMLSLLVRYA